ncbi:hypothetical protein ECDEC12A_5631 [Escherichia coli DEC12A]|nr:hypothetical protein ECDEC12A_5631 [Escherichia coli DEC12A]
MAYREVIAYGNFFRSWFNTDGAYAFMCLPNSDCALCGFIAVICFDCQHCLPDLKSGTCSAINPDNIRVI